MAAKSKGKQHGSDIQQEDVFQAVVIADSFDVRFAPITDKKPRTLLPICNTPMLDHTLEFLVTAGVQEIFVFCCHHAEQIKNHIRSSKWIDECLTCTVTTISSDSCMSMGDALREIHDKSVIRNDFVLVFGDVVSTIKLQEILEEHKKRRETDSSSVMTMIFTKAPPGKRSRNSEDDMVMAIENTSNRLLHYQKITDKKIFQLPVEVLADNKNVQLHYDLMDSQISICSPLVPALYKDNFDYLAREDFVKGILINEEIMGNTIHVSVVKDEYAARISSPYMYDIVSRDILSRWTYPIVPDNSNTETSSSVSYGRHNVYLSKDVTLARGCVLEEGVFVGSGTSVSTNTKISNSVIGKDCTIGENVTIDGTYIWNGVTIEDNCKIETSILCDNVVVHKSVNIRPHCILSWNVKVGPNITIQEATRLKASPSSDDDDDFGDDDLPEADQGTVSVESSKNYGSESEACLYTAEVPAGDSDDEEEDCVQDMWGHSIPSESEYETSSASADSSFDDAPLDDLDCFYAETLDTLDKAKEDSYSTDNLILEINGLKHTYNIAIKDLYGMVVKGIVEQPMRDDPDVEGVNLLTHMKKNLTKFLGLIQNYIKSGDSQMEALYALEDFCISNSKVSIIHVKLIHHLYELDVLSEQAIMKWFKAAPQTAEEKEKHLAVRKQVEPLIRWLQEADEESSEEDE